METRVTLVLFQSLTVALYLFSVMWLRKFCTQSLDKGMPDGDARSYYKRVRRWEFRNAWAYSAGNLFPTIGLIAPMREELIYRALVIAVFDRFDLTAVSAIMLSSLIFGRAHYKDRLSRDAIPKNTTRFNRNAFYILRFVSSTILGGVCAVIGIYYGSIWPAVFAHIGWNSTVYVVGSVQVAWRAYRMNQPDRHRFLVSVRRSVVNQLTYLE